MKPNRTYARRRSIPIILMLCVSMLGITPTVHGDIVPTETLYQQADVAEGKAQIRELLARDDVRARLLEMGVSPEDVDARVDSLGSQEVMSLQENMESMPAGEGVLGVIIALLVIFILTDIAGATDIFPGV